MTEKTSNRMERIASAISHEISQYINRHMDDKRLKQAQIARTVVSKDLSFAKIYFTVSDATIEVKKLTQALNHAAPIFRRHLADALDLRVTPEVKFYFDEQAAKTSHLLDVLAKL